MAVTMTVEVVSPESVLFSGEATMVITRTLGGGEIAFLAGHAPFLGALTENHTRVFLADGGVDDIAVHGGFVEVSDNKVSILSDIGRARLRTSTSSAPTPPSARAEERLRQERRRRGHQRPQSRATGPPTRRRRQRLTARVRTVTLPVPIGARHRRLVGDRRGDGGHARRRRRLHGRRRPPRRSAGRRSPSAIPDVEVLVADLSTDAGQAAVVDRIDRRRATGRARRQQRRLRHQRRFPRARPRSARRGDRGQRGGADAAVARRAVGDAAARLAAGCSTCRASPASSRLRISPCTPPPRPM